MPELSQLGIVAKQHNGSALVAKGMNHVQKVIRPRGIQTIVHDDVVELGSRPSWRQSLQWSARAGPGSTGSNRGSQRAAPIAHRSSARRVCRDRSVAGLCRTTPCHPNSTWREAFSQQISRGSRSHPEASYGERCERCERRTCRTPMSRWRQRNWTLPVTITVDSERGHHERQTVLRCCTQRPAMQPLHTVAPRSRSRT